MPDVQPLKLDIAVVSKAGGRTGNEDACGYWTSDKGCCWVLSDGAGGHEGGDVASKSVVASVLREFVRTPEVTPEAVTALILHANDVLLHEQRSRERLHDMRATVTVVVLDRVTHLACWGHLGDSRVYGFRSGHIRFQSRDHSVIQSMLDAGIGDPAMLRQHPRRGVLLAALGASGEIQPEVSAVEPVRDGDVFMLCSDGLWEYVEEGVMERLLATSSSAENWVAALEAEILARATAGHDNYSAIAVWVGDRTDITQIILSR